MILTGKEIAKEVLAGRIVIDPFTPSQVQPNSYDFRLGDKLLVYDRPTVKVETRAGQPARNVPDPSWHLDAHRQNPTKALTIPAEGLILQPGTLYLGHTVERVGSEHFVPMIAARSSSGRMGLMVYLNSGFGDLGFINQWTLELTVVHPLLIRPGDRVGQFHFHIAYGEVELYRGSYGKGEGPKAVYEGAIADKEGDSLARR